MRGLARPSSAPLRRSDNAKTLARQGALENEVAVLRKRHEELTASFELACQERDASKYEVSCLRRDLKRSTRNCRTCTDIKMRCKQLLASRDLARQECLALKETLSQPQPCELCRPIQQKLKAVERRLQKSQTLQNINERKVEAPPQADEAPPQAPEGNTVASTVHDSDVEEEIQRLHEEVLQAKCQIEEAEATAEQWRREVEAWREALQSVCRKLTARTKNASETQEIEESIGPKGVATAALTAALTAEANLKTEHRSVIKKREGELQAEHKKAFSELERAAEAERKKLKDNIEKQTKKHEEAMKALEAENFRLREQLVELGIDGFEELQVEHAALVQKYKELEASVQKYWVGASRHEADEARAELKIVARENDVLKMALKGRKQRADDVVEYAICASPSKYERSKYEPPKSLARLENTFHMSPSHGSPSASSLLREGAHIQVSPERSPSSSPSLSYSRGTSPSHASRGRSPSRDPPSFKLPSASESMPSRTPEQPHDAAVAREWKRRLDEADAWRETMRRFKADTDYRVECLQKSHQSEQMRMQREMAIAYETAIAEAGKRLGSDKFPKATKKQPVKDYERGLPDWARAATATGVSINTGDPNV